MFTDNETKLIEQTQRCLAGEMSDPAAIAILRLRLRNVAEKYRELSKRERFQKDINKNSSALSTKNNARKAEHLEALLRQMN